MRFELDHPAGVVRILLCVALMVGATLPSAAQDGRAPVRDFPTKPVQIIVPVGPGGGADTHMRALAQQLAAQWSQPVIVENRPGADGIIGAASVAKARPDGYTLLAGLATLPVVPHLYKNVPYDHQRDLAPVTLVSTTPIVLVVATNVAAVTLEDWIGALRANPNRYGYGSTEGLMRMFGAQFAQSTDTRTVHVGYKGGAQMINDLIGGHLAMAFATSTVTLPHAKSGRLKVLAVASDRRTALMPDVPTLAERGIAGFDQDPWYGLLAPAGTPPAIIATIQREVARALQSSAMQEQCAKFGLTAVGSTPAEFAAALNRDTAKWARVARDGAIQAEQ